MRQTALIIATMTALGVAGLSAVELPDPATTMPVKLLDAPHYTEGVVFDHAGLGYFSEADSIWQFSLDGAAKVFAVTGAPNGHKILADGTHLVCDASRHAVLHLAADGRMLEPASTACDGKPLRGPNDLTLDTPHNGFYFTDPGGSDENHPIGTVHYVDQAKQTSLVAGEIAFPNGIVLRPDGKQLLVGESKHNRILLFDVTGPGKVDHRRVFADLPKKDPAAGQVDNQPDGMCLDAEGNLYIAHYGMHTVEVLSPEGKLIRRYEAGTLTTSNVAFGGPDMDRLFVTGALAGEQSGGAVFRLDLKVKGLVILPAKAN